MFCQFGLVRFSELHIAFKSSDTDIEFFFSLRQCTVICPYWLVRDGEGRRLTSMPLVAKIEDLERTRPRRPRVIKLFIYLFFFKNKTLVLLIFRGRRY